jgi:hypothetical protein
MTAEMSGLILGLAGLVSTLISTALGLYFTARARTAPMREMLYAKQIHLARQFLRAYGRVRLYAVLLVPPGEYAKMARRDLVKVAHRLTVLGDDAALLFPTELYVAVKATVDMVPRFLSRFDEGGDTSGFIDEFLAAELKVGLLARAALGIDELSDESVRLFSKTSELAKLAGVSGDELLGKERRKAPTKEKA